MITMRRSSLLGVSVAALCVAHCGGSVVTTNMDGGAMDRVPPPDGRGGDAAQHVPENHRPNDSQCLTTPPPSNCDSGDPSSTCKKDSDCMAGLNGRCVLSGMDGIECACSYDTCTSYKECTMGGPCSCHGSVDMSSGNVCAPGNCQVDADCASGGGYCSPSDAQVNCGGLPSYYCHTPSDECVNDSDCSGASACGTFDCGCAYDDSSHRWTCQAFLGCG
jgi:hypothetical protein